MPDAEVKHLAPRRRSRAPLLLLLLLLLVAGAVGAGLYAVFDVPEPPVVALADAPSARVVPVAPDVPAAPAASPAEAEAPPAAAAIIDDHPLAQLTRPDDDARVAQNPLSALAVTAAPPPPQAALSAPKDAGPTVRRAQHAANAAGPQPAPRAKQPQSKDSDAALLATLMSYGLPPASPPGTKVYKSDGIFVRELPGSPLPARLEQCRKLGFLESEQCRLRVCAGHWGTAPECPNPQANIEP